MRCCWSAGRNGTAGVVGIVAGRLREKFNRPVCVGGTADGMVKGSGRSVPGPRSRRGGHRGAPLGHSGDRRRACHGGRLFHGAFHGGGLPRFPLRPAAKGRGCAAAAAPARRGEASPQRVPPLALAKQLAKLAPFGTGNEEPMIVVPDVRGDQDRQAGQRWQHAARLRGRGGWRAPQGDAVPRRRWACCPCHGRPARRPAASRRASACARCWKRYGKRQPLRRGRPPAPDARAGVPTLDRRGATWLRSARLSRSSRGLGHQLFTLGTAGFESRTGHHCARSSSQSAVIRRDAGFARAATLGACRVEALDDRRNLLPHAGHMTGMRGYCGLIRIIAQY